MLYKGDKDVDAAARPSEGDPVEARVLLASSSPGIDHLSMLELATRRWPSRGREPFGLKSGIDRPAWMPDSPLKSLCNKHSS